MCRRALHRNMKISLSPAYHERRARQQRKNQIPITAPAVPAAPAAPAAPTPTIAKPNQTNQTNQIFILYDVVVSFD